MKKLFIFALMMVSIGLVVPTAEARSNGATELAATTETVQFYNRRRRGRRTVTTTRIRRVGRYRYRETIRVTYLANGRTRTQVIRRVRLVGGRRW